jgi:hypothetical protein
VTDPVIPSRAICDEYFRRNEATIPEVASALEMVSILEDGFVCDSRVVRGAWNRVTVSDACDRLMTLAYWAENRATYEATAHALLRTPMTVAEELVASGEFALVDSNETDIRHYSDPPANTLATALTRLDASRRSEP